MYRQDARHTSISLFVFYPEDEGDIFPETRAVTYKAARSHNPEDQCWLRRRKILKSAGIGTAGGRLKYLEKGLP
jgi:hypothetical protein